MKHVLVVDDEAHIREVVEYALQREGFRVTLAADGRAALEASDRQPPDLVVLDVMLPEIDGLEVCRVIRRKSRAPILFLSSRAEEVDRIVGLELGGDDYLTKPFSPRELVARVRAVFRRYEDAKAAAAEEWSSLDGAGLHSGDARPARDQRRALLLHDSIRIDFERHEVRCGSELVDLTPSELALLAALIERPGVVLSRAELVERGHGDGTVITERTIDTHVRRIRRKFGTHGLDPITTVHGVGYKASGA
jgi:two-component system, OmpR family, response regulator